MMKTKHNVTKGKANWIADVREGLGLMGPIRHFNDKHKGSRRIKFYLHDLPLDDSEMSDLQEYIQSKRPDLNVTVARKDNDWWGNYTVTYRPKVGNVMFH